MWSTPPSRGRLAAGPVGHEVLATTMGPLLQSKEETTSRQQPFYPACATHLLASPALVWDQGTL